MFSHAMFTPHKQDTAAALWLTNNIALPLCKHFTYLSMLVVKAKSETDGKT